MHSLFFFVLAGLALLLLPLGVATFNFYGNGRKKMVDGSIDLDGDTLKMALATSSYTPNKDTHDFFDDITNEVTGTGYSAGGATLGSKTLTLTAANSWAVSWASGTAYAVGDIVIPGTPNGHLYRCIVAGTSDSSGPSFPTVSGATVVDNTVTWAEMGTNTVAFDCADISWATSTITARYGILYKSTGTASTSPVIGYIDFGTNVSSTAATFQITIHTAGVFQL